MRLCREDDQMAYGTCSVRNEAIIPVSGKSIDKAKSRDHAYAPRHRINKLLSESQIL